MIEQHLPEALSSTISSTLRISKHFHIRGRSLLRIRGDVRKSWAALEKCPTNEGNVPSFHSTSGANSIPSEGLAAPNCEARDYQLYEPVHCSSAGEVLLPRPYSLVEKPMDSLPQGQEASGSIDTLLYIEVWLPCS